MFHGSLHTKKFATVGKTVRRHVQYAHHQRLASEHKFAVAQFQPKEFAQVHSESEVYRTGRARRLKREALRKHPAVIVGVKLRYRDLHSNRRREPQSLPQSYASESDPGRQEHLLLSLKFARFIERRVHFQLRPELPTCSILERRIPLDLPAQLRCASCRQVHSDSRLRIEPAPTFSERDSRR